MVKGVEIFMKSSIFIEAMREIERSMYCILSEILPDCKNDKMIENIIWCVFCGVDLYCSYALCAVHSISRDEIITAEDMCFAKNVLHYCEITFGEENISDFLRNTLQEVSSVLLTSIEDESFKVLDIFPGVLNNILSVWSRVKDDVRDYMVSHGFVFL